jgi:single-stranded DNA-binding protein
MGLNRVIVLGTVGEHGPKLMYSDRGRPACRLTLLVDETGKDGQTFTLYLPTFVYGDAAERCAESLDAGDVVAIDGRLSWKSELKKDGTKLGLVVTCFGVELVQKVEASAAVTP